MKREKLVSGWINTIQEAVGTAKTQAAINGTEVEFDFNGINIVVAADTNTSWLLRDYFDGHLMGWKEVGPNPLAEYTPETVAAITAAKEERERLDEIRRQEYEKQQAAKQDNFNKEVEGVEMEFVDKDIWDTWVLANQDGYGKGVMTFAENWAKLMQKHLADGKTLDECADADSTAADTEGITGFMFGCAVNILSKAWKHGEALRVLHNKKYGQEGPGVVNPAIITVSTKD